MKKQTVLFDMDNCPADFTGGIVRFVNQYHPHLDFSKEKLSDWDILELITCQIAKQETYLHMQAPGFFLNLDPIPEALTAYQTLVELGHRVRICTTPLPRSWPVARMHSKRDKKAWVRKYLGRRAEGNMIFSDDKREIYGDVIIDDKPTLTVGNTKTRFRNWLIVDNPYNQIIPESQLLPIGRINNDWSNWQEEFAKLELI